MTEETSTPASAPAAEHEETLSDILRSTAEREEITPAEEPAEDAPAEETPAEEEPKRKKLSGAERAKRREEYLLNEHRTREEHLLNELQERESRLQERESRLEELERYVSQTDDERRSEENRRKRDDAHLERLKSVRETITDWDAVMAKMRGVHVHEDVIDEIKASDKSELLTYHLANNPEKVRELNSLNGRELAREIVRMEGTLRMPEGKKQTKAPPPPTTLKGGAAPHTKLEDVSDMGTFAKRLISNLDKRGRR